MSLSILVQLILTFTIPFTICFVTCLCLKQFLHYKRNLLLLIGICISSLIWAQYKVKGTVYDSSRLYPIELVTVQSTGGKLTMTDSTGKYIIDVAEKDSVWFSFLGKPTPKYPVLKIPDVTQFDIALRLRSDVMKEVKIKTRNYIDDSLQNRKTYAKVFGFQRPNISTLTSVTSSGVGFDLDEIIRAFQFRKNRSMEHFRQRLEQEERDKFVDRRFTKLLVKRLTGLQKEEEVSSFMKKYRPTFEFTAGTSDYDFQYYIKIAFTEFKKSQLPSF